MEDYEYDVDDSEFDDNSSNESLPEVCDVSDNEEDSTSIQIQDEGPVKSHGAVSPEMWEQLTTMTMNDELGIEGDIVTMLARDMVPPMNIDVYLEDKANIYTLALVIVLLAPPMIVVRRDGHDIDLSMFSMRSVLTCVKYKYPFCRTRSGSSEFPTGSRYQHNLLLKYFPVLFGNIDREDKHKEKIYPEELEELEQARAALKKLVKIKQG